MKHVKEDMEIHIPKFLYVYWSVTWKFITPATLLVIFGLSISQFQPGAWGTYVFPSNIQALGWMTTVVSLLVMPAYAGYVFVYKKMVSELLKRDTNRDNHAMKY